MITEKIQHRDGNTTHLLAERYDWGSTTYCGKSYYAAVVVESAAQWTEICWDCRLRHAVRTGKRIYKSPELRKNRPTDARKLRHDLKALEERQKWDAFVMRPVA